MKPNKPTIPRSPNRSGGLVRFTQNCCLATIFALGFNATAQEVLWQESFETDGEGSRYFTEGVAVFEPDSFADNGISADQGGPVYWTRIADGVPSFTGVPAPTPERRIVMAWGSGIIEDDITDEFWTHFDGVVDWLLRGKSNATILFSGLGGEGDQALATRLESKGHTVEEDAGGDLPDSGIDMFVYSGGSTSRFVNYNVPGLHYNSGDLDDELLSSIGTALTTTLPEVRITAPGHASAAGQEGSFTFVNNENTFQGIGTELPGGSTVVAAFVRSVSASVLNLDAADALFDGTTPNTGVSTTTVTVADIVSPLSPASQIAFFDWDNPIAGNPDGGFAIRATGAIEASAGTVSLAIGGADGSRLRIDLDGNGLSADDNIIALDRRGAWQYSASTDVTFPSAGSFDFEWVSFNAAAEFGSEFLVALDAGGGAEAVSEEAWDLVSSSSAHVKIDGNITVETYIPDLPPEEVQTPFTMALEAPEDGGAVFGGGPFGNYDGDSAFGGSALNKFTGDDGVGSPKWITWNDPIDVSGKDKVKLTIATGASFLDFETGDYLKVYIDDGTDPLIWFTAPTGDDKFFNDAMTNPSNPTRLGLALQDITYDIPAGVNSINLRIEAITTWWNEIVVFDNIRVTSGDIVVAPSGPAAVVLANLDNDAGAEADAAVAQALTDLYGFNVNIVDDDTVAGGEYTIDTARADGVELIYIGSSVNSGSVVSQPWQDLGVPIVNVEQATQDDFLSVDPLDARGNADGQDSATVVAAGNPLAGGLSNGDHLVTGGIQTHWGTPTASATIIAHQPDDATHAVVYGIDAGAALQDGSASKARFVHLGFLGDAGFATIEPAGMALWRAGVNWALGIAPKALLLGNIENEAAVDSDAAIAQAISDTFGYDVIIVDDDVVAAGDYTVDDAAADGIQLIYIGSSVNSGSVVSQPWQDLGVPIVNVEQATQDDFLSVDPLDARANTDGQDSVTIAAAGHPLAGGLSAGDHLVTGAMQTHWGTAIASATVVAHEPGDPTHAVVYGIEAGAALQDGSPSKARFVHLGFLGDSGFGVIEPAGRTLWEAGISWALGITSSGGGGGGEAGTLNAPALGANGDVTLSWDGAGTLEESADVSGPWAASASQDNPQTRTPSGTAFFRLVP